MRARIKRRQRRRNIAIIAVVAIVIAAIIGVAYFLYSLTAASSPLIGKPVSASIYSSLSGIASSSSYGPYNVALVSSSIVQDYSGQPFTSGGKPILLYIGGEFCPLCAFQRWPLVIALMRFGNLTNLSYMQSSSTDSDPNTSTFSFVNMTAPSYTSKYIVFEHYEQEDRKHNPLQTVPSNYTSVFQRFGEGYPFLDFANKYVIEGSFYDPSLFAGLNWTQIVQQIQNPSTQLSVEVMSSANALTALICNMTDGSPSSVCTNPSIVPLSTSLTSYRESASPTFVAAATSPTLGNSYNAATLHRNDAASLHET